MSTPMERLRLIDDNDWLRLAAAPAVATGTRPRSAAPWRMQDLPEPYLEGMLKGIVGLDIAVSRLEGKFKLSQNRPAADRPRIVAALEARGDADAVGIARLMRDRERALSWGMLGTELPEARPSHRCAAPGAALAVWLVLL